MKVTRAIKVLGAITLFAGFACAQANNSAPANPLAPPPTQESQRKPKDRTLHWNPPLLDAPIRSRISQPPCALSNALEKAAARASEMVNNLQNFTAQERVDYQAFDRLDYPVESGRGVFDYIVYFQSHGGGVTVQENRSPGRNARLFAVVNGDVGLPVMALIFLPEMQIDYEMECEATNEWLGRPTWVVRFHQREDRPSHTVGFVGEGGAVHQAKLKGRAWIVPESGEIVHIDTGLMEGIPAAHIRHWYLSIDYGPVQFRTEKREVWLPQTVDAFYQFENRRAIVYHTFTNFMLFSVHTDQTIATPPPR